MLQNLAFTAILLGVLVFVHELGHFLVAKAFKVKVLRFSIGFGPKVLAFTRGETEYRLAWIPLGGYVKMAGELPTDEVAPEDRGRGFLAQPPWKRALIVTAGPAFNLVFPILAYFFVFWGGRETLSTRVGSVEPGLPAAEAGLVPGDRIVAVDGEKVEAFSDLQLALQTRYERKITIQVERNGQNILAELQPLKRLVADPVETLPRGVIGVSPVPAAPQVGVPSNSPAALAGLKTFDRVLSVNGQKVTTEADLFRVLAGQQGMLELKVLRSEPVQLPGVNLEKPNVETVKVERMNGEGYAALGGAERSDLYVGNVVPESVAAKAGLKRGDRLVSFNDKPLRSFVWFDIALSAAEEKPFKLAWRGGDGTEASAELKQAKVESTDEFAQGTTVLDLGVRPRPALSAGEPELIKVHRGVGRALTDSMRIVPEVIRKTGLVIGHLFMGNVPFKSVGGPVMLYQIASRSAEEGIDSFLNTMAVISVNLGLMNLLPIPVLDGFQLLVAVWEGVRRRPIPMRAREIAHMIGLAVLILLMVLVMKNDLTR